MEKRREHVKGLDGAGKEQHLAVVRPTPATLDQAAYEYHKRMASLMRAGAGEDGGDRLMLREEIDQELMRRRIFTAADAARFVGLSHELVTLEIQLATNGTRELASRMVTLRSDLMALWGKRSAYDNTTIEAHAETHRLRWLAVNCITHADSGNPYFSDIADYLAKQHEPVVQEVARVLAKMIFGYDENAVTPEQAYLDNLDTQVDGPTDTAPVASCQTALTLKTEEDVN